MTQCYTWTQGRRLDTIVGNGYDISFKYNDVGIRTQKIVDTGEEVYTTDYYLVGDKVTYETAEIEGTTYELYYTYDSTGRLVSFSIDDGGGEGCEEYYYLHNIQGDVMGLICGSTGNLAVTYTYDTWGKILSIDGPLANSVGELNPYRYRGYRYDTETGLYYLQSRYYNPEWGRFLNADAIFGEAGNILSHNMYAYCGNDPVNYADPSGYSRESCFWTFIYHELEMDGVIEYIDMGANDIIPLPT